MTGTNFETAIEIYASTNTISSHISPSESERFFVFNAELGKNYVFRTSGSYDLIAFLYDESRDDIKMDDDSAGNLNPLIAFYSNAEKYYFSVKGYNAPNERVNFNVSLIESEWDVEPEPEPSENRIQCKAINIYGYGTKRPVDDPPN